MSGARPRQPPLSLGPVYGEEHSAGRGVSQWAHEARVVRVASVGAGPAVASGGGPATWQWPVGPVGRQWVAGSSSNPSAASVLTLAPNKLQLSSVHLLQLSVGGSEGNNSESGPRTFANYFKYFSTFLTYFWCLNLACYESYAAPSYSYSWQCDIESNCVIAF